MLPVHDALARTDRGGWKSRANNVTFGAALENGVPDVPSAQRSGTVDGSAAYAVQSGIGVAGPTHTICCAPDGRPVLSSAEPIIPELALLANSPIPPRRMARGARNAPANAEISCECPSVC